MPRILKTLAPGTRFKVVGLNETGTLIRANDCRALVREDRPSTEVTFTDADGEVRQFQGRKSHLTSWAPNTVVEPIQTPAQEIDMTTKTEKKSVAKKVETKSKPTESKMSALDAAAKVLGDSKEPMGCKEMIEKMAARKLWTSPGGKTPASTLYSSLLREINTKGKESRFKKVERGKFVATGK